MRKLKNSFRFDFKVNLEFAKKRKTNASTIKADVVITVKHEQYEADGFPKGTVLYFVYCSEFQDGDFLALEVSPSAWYCGKCYHLPFSILQQSGYFPRPYARKQIISLAKLVRHEKPK